MDSFGGTPLWEQFDRRTRFCRSAASRVTVDDGSRQVKERNEKVEPGDGQQTRAMALQRKCIRKRIKMHSPPEDARVFGRQNFVRPRRDSKVDHDQDTTPHIHKYKKCTTGIPRLAQKLEFKVTFSSCISYVFISRRL